MMAIDLYVGSTATKIKGDRVVLNGLRCATAVYGPYGLKYNDPDRTSILLDSGAFTDSPCKRLSAKDALARQLAWESKAAQIFKKDRYCAEYLCSYDYLIDETWVEEQVVETKHTRIKRRWDVKKAKRAVEETIQNARYLSRLRSYLRPRKLVMVCQGVSFDQYLYCIDRVLEFAEPGDVVGFGGWCILGMPIGAKWRKTFFRVMEAAVPKIKSQGIDRAHIFGSLYLPCLGGALWLCDRHKISLSVDSSRPLLDHTRKNLKKSKARGKNWKESVVWWQSTLLNLRESEYYSNPFLYQQLELNFASD